MSIRQSVDPRTLDKRAQFQRLREDDAARTASGERPIDWRALTSAWARLDGVSGTETEAADQTMRQVRYEVVVRAEVVARAGIREKDRVLVGGLVLNIVAVPLNGKRGRFVFIDCVEGANEG